MPTGGGTTTQTTEIPAHIEQGQKNVIRRGEAIANRPYVPYAGARIAPWSGDQQAAFGLNRANAGVAGAQMSQPLGMFGQVMSQGAPQVSAPQAGTATMNPASTNAAMMNPAMARAAQMSPASTNAAMMQTTAANTPAMEAATIAPTVNAAAAMGHQHMGAYVNPYQSQVIEATTNEMGRQNALLQKRADQVANQAGAFGGSRHGVINAENDRNFIRAIGDTTAQMNHSMLNTALNAGMADAGRATQNNQFNAANENQRRLNQASLQQQANASNQAISARLGMFNAANATDASRANAAAENQIGMFNTSAANQASAQNAGLAQQVALANQASANSGAARNQDALNQIGMFNTNNANDAAARNMGAINQLGMFNAGNQMTANLANQQAAITNTAQRLQAGGMFGDALGQQEALRQGSIDNLMRYGSAQQGMDQRHLDLAYDDFRRQTQYPIDMFGLYQSAVSGIPVPQNITTNQRGSVWNTISGLGQLAVGGAQAAATGGMFSDRRTKTNIKPIGSHKGRDWYSYRYVWDGPTVTRVGLMADENPDVAVDGPAGLQFIDYSKVAA